MKFCSIPDCGKKHYGRGWCGLHYARWRIHGNPLGYSIRQYPPLPPKPCGFPGCARVGKVTKGLCPTHYMRLLRRGDPSIVLPAGSRGKGRAAHPLYRAWAQMINRCENPNNYAYHNYGARGVCVCERWRADFLNFLADMGERPEGMTLDRIDPYGPYSPENCRWATSKTQRNNKTKEGDERTRAGAREAKKEYWRRWRSKRGLPPEPPTRAEYRQRAKFSPGYLRRVADAVQRRPE